MNFKYLIFIPARSGSKGLKNKNLKKINGNSLLDITIQHAKNLKLRNSFIYVSTDSKKYLKNSKRHKLSIPFLRSKKNSSNKANIIEAILEFLKKSEHKFENIILLQPTSPLRKIHQFKDKVKDLDKKNINSLISVKNLKRNDDFIFNLKNKKFIDLDKSIVANPNRQNSVKYTPCGCFYSTKVRLLLKNKSLFNPPMVGIETTFPDNLDIDDEVDYKIAKFLS